MPTKRPRPTPAELCSGRFPWDAVDRGDEQHRAAARQQAAVAQWVVQHMTVQGVTQRDLERAGIAAQSTVSALVTGRSWTDMWVVARIVAHLGGQLGVKGPERRQGG